MGANQATSLKRSQLHIMCLETRRRKSNTIQCGLTLSKHRDHSLISAKEQLTPGARTKALTAKMNTLALTEQDSEEALVSSRGSSNTKGISVGKSSKPRGDIRFTGIKMAKSISTTPQRMRGPRRRGTPSKSSLRSKRSSSDKEWIAMKEPAGAEAPSEAPILGRTQAPISGITSKTGKPLASKIRK